MDFRLIVVLVLITVLAAPAMPYGHYGKLTDADAHALAAYLKSLKPVRHQVPAITGDAEKPKAPYLTVVFPK